MIVFLAPDAKRAEELDQAVRDFLAWQSIAATEDRIKELDLSASRRPRPGSGSRKPTRPWTCASPPPITGCFSRSRPVATGRSASTS